jgi:hypothetical protein
MRNLPSVSRPTTGTKRRRKIFTAKMEAGEAEYLQVSHYGCSIRKLRLRKATHSGLSDACCEGLMLVDDVFWSAGICLKEVGFSVKQRI